MKIVLSGAEIFSYNDVTKSLEWKPQHKNISVGNIDFNIKTKEKIENIDEANEPIV